MRERTLKARTEKEATRAVEVILNRDQTPKTVFWLSFVGKEGFRGVVIVHAEDFLTALMETNLRGINPQGECQGAVLPEELAARIGPEWKNRILSKADCQRFDEAMEPSS
jgi:hypothetical protein